MILTLLGITAFYLWPDVKAIGWGCAVAGIFVLVAWAILEIRSYHPVSKLPSPATESAPQPSQSAPGKGKPTAYSELQKAIEKVSAESSDWTTGVHKCESAYWRYTNSVTSGRGRLSQSDKDQAGLRYALCVQTLMQNFHPAESMSVGTAVEDAIERMQMPVEKQITPNEASQLRQAYEAALVTAETPPSLNELQTRSVDPRRFEQLVDFLTELLKQLGGYRESPM